MALADESATAAREGRSIQDGKDATDERRAYAAAATHAEGGGLLIMVAGAMQLWWKE